MMNILFRGALLLLVPPASAYPQPEPCEGWCYKDLRDPNIVLKHGTFYRFTTNHNFSISTAPSMAGPWTKKGSAFHDGSRIRLPMKPTGKNHEHLPPYQESALWAPDVLLVDDTYYMTYTVTRGGRPNDIGVATSKTLEPGSWEDHGSIGLPESANNNRIDSNLFQTEPGSKPLLAFGSYLHGLFQVPLTLPPTQMNGEVTAISHNKSNIAMEAAYQFQWDVQSKRWYYLFFSSGRCCNAPNNLPPQGDEYKIMVCRSESSTGPFVDDTNRKCLDGGGKLILGSHDDVYGPGGQGVLWDEQLKAPVIYYHYMNKTMGYDVADVYFGWNRLDFESGWPVLVDAAGNGENVAHAGSPKPQPNGGNASTLSHSVSVLSVLLSLAAAVGGSTVLV